MKKRIGTLLAVTSLFALLSVGATAQAATVADMKKSEATVGFYEGPSVPDTNGSNHPLGQPPTYSQLPKTGSTENGGYAVAGLVTFVSAGILILKTNYKKERN